jgi:hypothetical protein
MRDVDPTLPRDGSDSIATNERDCTAITEPRAIATGSKTFATASLVRGWSRHYCAVIGSALLRSLLLVMIANIVWPALYLISRLLSVWVILSSLFIEFFFLWKLLRLDAKQAILADVLMNLVSTILGIILIGELGLIVVLPFRNAFGAGAWVATIILGIGVNGCVESMVVRQWFKPDFGLRDFWLLLAANALTVGIAYGSLGLFPIHQ